MNESNNMNEDGEVMDTSFFLGNLPWQNLSIATPKHLFIYVNDFVEGSLMILGNLILVSAILAYRQLRRKEMFILAGLAFGDLVYGFGYLFSGIRRTSLGLMGRHLWKVTPWHCMGAIQNPFFIVGSQAAALMLVMVSVDRLLAVRWFAVYMTLGSRYAKRVISIVFGYSISSMIGTVFLSAYATPPEIRVPAICISTHVGPEWFSSYQPTVQLICGLLSVIIYGVTWYFYKKQTRSMSGGVKNQQLKRQRKLTKTVGITVLFTFVCYVIPHSMIFFFNTFPEFKELAGLMSPYGWAIGNINSFVNIFILGVHNNDVHRILNAWICCRKPEFAGGHTLTKTGASIDKSRSPLYSTNTKDQWRSRMDHAHTDPYPLIEQQGSRTNDGKSINTALLIS